MARTPEIQSILKLKVPMIVRIADHQLTLGAVMDLAPGVMIELPRLADEPLDLMVNNKKIGSGEAVKIGENFGLRVTAVGDTADRIRALGPEDEAEPAAPSEAGGEMSDDQAAKLAE